MRIGFEAVLGEHDGGAAESIRLDDVGAGGKIGAMDVQHGVGPCAHQDFVTAFQRRAAEIGRAQARLLQHGAHGAVQAQDAPLQGLE